MCVHRHARLYLKKTGLVLLAAVALGPRTVPGFVAGIYMVLSIVPGAKYTATTKVCSHGADIPVAKYHVR